MVGGRADGGHPIVKRISKQDIIMNVLLIYILIQGKRTEIMIVKILNYGVGLNLLDVL